MSCWSRERCPLEAGSLGSSRRAWQPAVLPANGFQVHKWVLIGYENFLLYLIRQLVTRNVF